MSEPTAAENFISKALIGMGIFFEKIETTPATPQIWISLLNEDDALEVACWFSQAGWYAEVEGRHIRAMAGAA
jgi:hypothetical protein